MMIEEDLSTRPDEADPLVLYLVVPKGLDMSPGKVAAQCGHAVQAMVLGYTELLQRASAGEALTADERTRLEDARAWITGLYRKVVLAADPTSWDTIKADLDGFLVKDVGFNEVARGAETAIALWPMRKSARPRVVRRLHPF